VRLVTRVLPISALAQCSGALGEKWDLAHTLGAAQEAAPLPGTKEGALALLPALGSALQKGQLEGNRSQLLATLWEARAVEERPRWKHPGGWRRGPEGPNGAYATEDEALAAAIAASLGGATEQPAPPAPPPPPPPLGCAASRVAQLPPLLRRALQRLRAVEMPGEELEAAIASKRSNP
jgi:hypothetical protein